MSNPGRKARKFMNKNLYIISDDQTESVPTFESAQSFGGVTCDLIDAAQLRFSSDFAELEQE